MTKRLVFGTNVLVSAALRRYSVPRQAVDYGLHVGTVLVSSVTGHELREVLFRPKFDTYASGQIRLQFLTALLNEVELVEITEKVTFCRDPKDGKFLEVAISGVATHIISGDNDLLVLHPFRSISIVTPRTFFEHE